MKHRTRLPATLVVSAAALALFLMATPAFAQETEHGDFGAYIYEGTCDNISGEAIEDVGDLDPDEGVWKVVGKGEQSPDRVWGEDEGISPTLDDLTGKQHVAVVRDDDDEQAPVVACGAIEGAADANGELVIQLNEVDGSGWQGRAHFGPKQKDDDEATEVTVAVWHATGGTPSATPAP